MRKVCLFFFLYYYYFSVKITRWIRSILATERCQERNSDRPNDGHATAGISFYLLQLNLDFKIHNSPVHSLPYAEAMISQLAKKIQREGVELLRK